jgi:hypothetical protein
MAITNGYTTLANVKAGLRITDSVDDALIEQAIEGSSRRIDGYCGRFFYQKTATVKLFANDPWRLMLQDLVSITSLRTDDDGDGTFEDLWAASEYFLEPTNATIQSRPYTAVTAYNSGKTFPISNIPPIPLIQIEGVWGWPAVPDDVEQACLLLSIRSFSRLNAALGVVGFADMAIQVRAVDPDVRDLLMPYVMLGIA